MIKNNFFYICISAMLLVVISIQPVYVYASNTTNAPAPASAAPTAKPYHFSVAVGESALLKNGRHRYDINPPMLVYDTVYMELGDICELLGIQWQWLLNDGGEILINDGNDSAGRTDGNDDVGHSDDNDRVNRANNNDDINGIDDVLRFKHFVRYDDLSAPQPQPQTQPRKYFAVDGKIYVPAVELADYTGYGVTYADGIMTMSPDGVEVFYEGNAFGAIDISGSERLLYNAYSEPAAHVVNPYKAYSYNDMTADALRLERMYPELIRTSGIGYSVEGREILLIKFGKGDIEIFVCGTHHAREYISTTYLMYAIDQYAYAYAAGAKWEAYDIIDLLEKVKFCIIPMLNPDGVNLVQNGIESIKDPEYVKSLSLAGSRYGYASWKANINGVDINRNYDFNWTHEKAYEYPRGYLAFGGDAPASEPETQVVSEYILSGNFEAFLSFHTQGQSYYFADDNNNPTGIDQRVRRETGFNRLYGGDIAGGTWFDFVRGHFGKTTMTVELCNYVGPYPYPDASFDNVWRPARNILPIFALEFSNRALRGINN